MRQPRPHGRHLLPNADHCRTHCPRPTPPLLQIATTPSNPSTAPLNILRSSETYRSPMQGGAIRSICLLLASALNSVAPKLSHFNGSISAVITQTPNGLRSSHSIQARSVGLQFGTMAMVKTLVDGNARDQEMEEEGESQCSHFAPSPLAPKMFIHP